MLFISFVCILYTSLWREVLCLWAEYRVFYTIKITPNPHVNTHTTPGGTKNKAIPSPINLTSSSVPRAARERARAWNREGPRKVSPRPLLSRLLSRLPPARLLFMISPKWSACSQVICSYSQIRARKFKKEKRLRSNDYFPLIFQTRKTKNLALTFHINSR